MASRVYGAIRTARNGRYGLGVSVRRKGDTENAKRVLLRTHNTHSSRIAQLALIDSLYTTVMFRKPGVPESLHAIRSAISLIKLDNPENYMSQL